MLVPARPLRRQWPVRLAGGCKETPPGVPLSSSRSRSHLRLGSTLIFEVHGRTDVVGSLPAQRLNLIDACIADCCTCGRMTSH
eukprot:5024438-Prymnesium_polylepis.1